MSRGAAYPHRLIKEIYDQPEAVRECIYRERERVGEVVSLVAGRFARLYVCGAGGAGAAAIAGSYFFHTLNLIPAMYLPSSEFAYYPPPLDESSLLVAISLSGETADTLAAVRKAKSLKACVIGVTNTPGSTLAKESDHVILTHAGREMARVTTKTYTTQLAALYLLAVTLGRETEALTQQAADELLQELERMPDVMSQTVHKCHNELKEKDIASSFAKKEYAYVIGRGPNYSVAVKSALMLKEGVFICAEGIAGGEVIHGLIVLVRQGLPIIGIVAKGEAYSLMVKNLRDVKRFGAYVLAIGEDEALETVADQVLKIPADVPEILSPLVTAIPPQLLVYKIALKKGIDPDKPVHVPKSRTAETLFDTG